MIEIKHRWTEEVIHRDEEAETLRDAVINAIANRADLGSANLRYADLGSANLGYANLGYANLGYANLRYANLRYANLRYANLRYADLRSADLGSANLRYANLPSPTMVLLACWGDLSQQLCADLMLFDSQNHPDPAAFDRWASGTGGCPYGDVHVSRAANFSENRKYWGQGQPCRPYDLMVRVLAEKCPDWSDEQIAEFMKRFDKE